MVRGIANGEADSHKQRVRSNDKKIIRFMSRQRMKCTKDPDQGSRSQNHRERRWCRGIPDMVVLRGRVSNSGEIESVTNTLPRQGS
jgi:hypothetical protein